MDESEMAEKREERCKKICPPDGEFWEACLWCSEYGKSLEEQNELCD